MLSRRQLLLAALATPITLMGCDNSPDGYGTSDLRRLPEASLLPPGAEVIQKTDVAGSTAKGPTHTTVRTRARARSTADEIFDFYAAELSARGWRGARFPSPGDLLLDARWSMGDFAFLLHVMDKTKASDVSAWEGWTTVYQVDIVAEGKKNE